MVLAQNEIEKQDTIFIAEYMIYPGCEKFKEDNKQLQICFSRALQNTIDKEASKFTDIMIERKISKAFTSVSLVVSKEGKIKDVEIVKESHKGLGNIIKTAVVSHARYLEKNNQLIVPAKLDDGTAIDFKVEYPVGYNVQF